MSSGPTRAVGAARNYVMWKFREHASDPARSCNYIIIECKEFGKPAPSGRCRGPASGLDGAPPCAEAVFQTMCKRANRTIDVAVRGNLFRSMHGGVNRRGPLPSQARRRAPEATGRIDREG